MRKCDESCDNCIYIGEGDFICDEAQEIVIDEWVPVYRECLLDKNKKETKK